MRDDQFPRSSQDVPESTSASAAPPPAFAPQGHTAVLSTPYGQATGRTSVLDAVRQDDPVRNHDGDAGTESLPPVPAAVEPSDTETEDGTASDTTDSPAAPSATPLEAEHEDVAAVDGTSAEHVAPASPEPAPEAVAEPAVEATAGPAAEPASPEALAGINDTVVDNALDDAVDTSTTAALTSTAATGHKAAAARRRWPLWTGAAAALLLLGVGVGGYAYASHYSERAVPGTSVGGVDVAGMTRAEIVDVVSTRADEAHVTIDGAVAVTAPLSDLGTTVDPQATADAAMKASESLTSRFSALVSDNAVAVVTSTDDAAVESYTASLTSDVESTPVNAGVTLGEDGTTFTVTPAQDGTGIDATVLAEAAQKAATTLTPQTVTTSLVTLEPTVSDAMAQEVADKANAVVALDVTVTGTDESQTLSPDAATKASWITITTDASGMPAVSINADAVSSWVDAQSATVAKEPVTGVRNVNSQGTVVRTRVEAVDGVKVTNAADVASQITSSLTAGTAFTGAFTTETVKATWEDKVIADGAEQLAYAAAPDEKWIDINLTNKTVTAYVGATIVHGPVVVVDGAAETPTVTGTFAVTRKVASETMRGFNADGTRYETKGVPWATYFYSGYAFHGAPWRSSFGYSGSHGCLNMPVSEAKWIYDWAPVGTPVVSHR